MKGDTDRAIADFDQAIKLDPKDAIALNNRGFAWRIKGDIARAAADYEQAIKLDAGNASRSTTAATPITRSATTIAPSPTSIRR